MEQQSLLSNIEFNPVLASTGKRFLNYLIDVILFYIISVFCLIALFYGRDSAVSDSFVSDILLRLIAMLLFAILYFLSELIFKGRTIGKFITGTKAVNEDGSEMEPKTILFRSLSRIVPFDALSAFGGHPWHDKWTGTIVIDIKETAANDISFQ